MKAYLIDPKEQEIKVVDYTVYNDISKFLEQPWFDVIRINEAGDVVYVDDEGLYRQPQYFWTYGEYPHPIAGRGLVLGTDREGDTRPPMQVSIYTLQETVRWLSIDEAMKMAKEISDRVQKEAAGNPAHIVVDSFEIMSDQEYAERPTTKNDE